MVSWEQLEGACAACRRCGLCETRRNVVKCRPPRNRDPLPEEQAACLPYLRAQVRLIRPKVIVCLGRIAAQAVIRPDFRITKEHGQWVERKGYWLTATYHPSALLRDPSKKRDAYEDLKKLKSRLEELGIPSAPHWGDA